LQSLVDSVHRDNHEDYVSISHYASPSLKRRMAALVDPPKAVQYLGTDTFDKNVMALRNLTALNVYDYASFAVSNRSFLLVTNGNPFAWLPSRVEELTSTHP
jgi:hypothetical protein